MIWAFVGPNVGGKRGGRVAASGSRSQRHRQYGSCLLLGAAENAGFSRISPPHERALRRFAVVILQQAPEPFAAANFACCPTDVFIRLNEPIFEALMIPFCKIMGAELSDSVPQHLLAKEHEAIETLRFYCPAKSLRRRNSNLDLWPAAATVSRPRSATWRGTFRNICRRGPSADSACRAESRLRSR